MVFIRLKNIIDEVFQDYKLPAMMLVTCFCDWKCFNNDESKSFICQNNEIIKDNILTIYNEKIIHRYLKNDITKSIIIAGLEPFLQFNELVEFIDDFRKISKDDIVVYTGYEYNEVEEQINIIKKYSNIVIKFGRFIPNTNSIYDHTLGIYLSSDNQYAIKIS